MRGSVQYMSQLAAAPAHAEDVWDGASKRSFAYDYASTLLVDRIVCPPLQFTAPELAGSVSDAPVTGKCDVFSLACVMYQVRTPTRARV